MKNVIAVMLVLMALSFPAFAEEPVAELSPQMQALKDQAAAGYIVGSVDAAYTLAMCYHFGKGGCPQDDAEAAKYLGVAGGRGDTDAMINLGDFLHQGIGVKQDDTQALNWYRLAAARGSPEGEYNIGKFYAGGYGVKADILQAIQWYLRAANQGLVEAQLDVARLYMQQNDYENAYLWFTIGATKGKDAGAADWRGRVGKTLTGDQLAAQQKKAQAWRAVSEYKH